MADEEIERQRVNTRTQFDYIPPGVDVNLVMGAPTEVLLRKARDRYTQAFTHRMVSVVE